MRAHLFLGALFVVIVAMFETNAQSCNTINGNSYDTTGDLVTLYNIASAPACCTACQAFVESQHWTYGISAKTCVCKSQNSGTLTASSSFTSGDISRTQYTQSGVTCGSLSSATDFSNNANNVKSVAASNASACCAPCQATTGCNFWTFYQGVCYLKSTNSGLKSNSATTSGSLSLPVAPLRTGSRGLGWFNSNTCTDLLSLTNLAWLYNWNDNPPANLIQCMMANGIEYIPMIWGKQIPVDTSTIYVAPNTKHLLTFNEPNFKSESNLSPAVAAAQWPAIQQFANSKGLLISSPAAAAGGTPDPISWLDQFFGNCTNCQVDFITTHIYTCSPAGTTGFLAQFKKYNKPIWLTEFDCPNTGSVATATNYVTSVLPLLDADPAYQRYAYFGLRVAPGDQGVGTENSIFNSSSNALTAIGVAYNSPPTSSTTAAPTPSPTTVKATTSAPTTVATTNAPTTVRASTAAPTTKASTAAPTTPAATTAATTATPTTPAPTTVKSTTSAPTTTPASTTAAPTTRTPTTAVPSTTAAPVTTARPSALPGKIVLQSALTSKYVIASSSTGSVLNATALTVASASVFTASPISGGGYSLWSITLSSFVCGDNWGSSPLIANRGSASTWETFNFTQQLNGYYTITAGVNGNFVETLPNGSLLPDVAVTSSPPTSALFIITSSS